MYPDLPGKPETVFDNPKTICDKYMACRTENERKLIPVDATITGLVMFWPMRLWLWQTNAKIYMKIHSGFYANVRGFNHIYVLTEYTPTNRRFVNTAQTIFSSCRHDSTGSHETKIELGKPTDIIISFNQK